MAGMGFAPKPGARQPNRGLGATAQAMRLPRSGRKGPVPPWPLDQQSKREEAIWRRIWSTPMAVAWEQLGWHDSVAVYVRLQAEAEQRNASAATRGEMRQAQDRLGLTPLALLRLRWQVVDDDEPEHEAASGVLSIRERLRADG